MWCSLQAIVCPAIVVTVWLFPSGLPSVFEQPQRSHYRGTFLYFSKNHETFFHFKQAGTIQEKYVQYKGFLDSGFMSLNTIFIDLEGKNTM